MKKMLNNEKAANGILENEMKELSTRLASGS